MGRAPCCDKANVKRGPWSPEEDNILKNYLETHGSTGGNWIALPRKAGLRRCGKSCRLRWLNYLRPDIKHGGFTEEEDGIICSLYSSIGSRWSVIASQLPGRTDNDVKNYWNTKLKKKLLVGKTDLKFTNNNDNMTTDSTNHHLNPTQFSASLPKVEACTNYGNSACFGTLPCPMDMSFLQNLDPSRLPLPRLMEVSEFGTSGSNSYGMSSSQEVSSLSNSPSLALGNSYASWPSSGSVEEDKILLDFGFESPYDLLNDFDFQDKSSGVAHPYLGNPSFTS